MRILIINHICNLVTWYDNEAGDRQTESQLSMPACQSENAGTPRHDVIESWIINRKPEDISRKKDTPRKTLFLILLVLNKSN